MGQKAGGFRSLPRHWPLAEDSGSKKIQLSFLPPEGTCFPLPLASPSSYQLAEVVAADLDHLPLIPDADHIILHMHLHAGHGGRRHRQPHWVAVHQPGLYLWGLHLLCRQGEQ